MAQAEYTIQIPQTDNEGNPLKDLAAASHESLWRYAPKARVEGARITRGVEGYFHGVQDVSLFDDLTVIGEDSPELDSTIKQLGVHICELANQWGIFIIKRGGGNVVTWTATSPNVTGDGPADPDALAVPPQEAVSAPGSLSKALRANSLARP